MMHLEFANEKEVASYIEEMLVELGKLSVKARTPVLTYLIEMAAAEATDIASSRCVSRPEGHFQPTTDLLKLCGKTQQK